MKPTYDYDNKVLDNAHKFENDFFRREYATSLDADADTPGDSGEVAELAEEEARASATTEDTLEEEDEDEGDGEPLTRFPVIRIELVLPFVPHRPQQQKVLRINDFIPGPVGQDVKIVG